MATASLPPPDPRALDRAAELIRAAARPVVIAGHQCLPEEAGWIRALVEALPAPLLLTAQANGLLPDAHPLVLGTFTRGEEDDSLLGLADVIVTCGLSPDELNPGRWPYSALVVQLTRTPPSGLPFVPLAEVRGDLSLILGELAPRLRGQSRADWDLFQLDRLKRTREGVS
jgi:acetolactate synthase-1/2/3 large subunit